MSAPAFEFRDPRVRPCLGDRFRREDYVQVDIWNLYTDAAGVEMVSIVATEKSGQVRDTLALDEFQLIAAGWRVSFVAGYVPKPLP